MDFELERYEVHYVCRKNKNGGVAVYIHKNLTYKVVENITVLCNCN